ncbi:MAG: bifunctional DNA-formamidopyrimidine glycosylase/DNA-(apurinic or apyrimidinic site) lyase [Myxococcales bacterium]|nr:bifunctional DNA-formamidopyrimidine glycosylase/DNA-(apurinic or apyrimidinic site) lyase [Myxococcales bacterium]
MPELPEVEITRQKLAPLLCGRTIARIETTADSYFFLTPPAQLKRALSGRRVEALNRRGKYLLAELDDGARLLLHLGMTGQLFADGVSSVRLLTGTGKGSLAPDAQAKGFTPDAHTHLRLHFDDGGPAVYFRDARKFGKVELLAAGARCARLERLGPDALETRGAELHAAAKKRKAPIKSVLLDQAVLAGVGNIYADEALFRAGIRPRTAARRLSQLQCERLVEALQAVMLRSIETGGSSISDYVQPDGQDGGYQDERRVYAREGLPCLQCETPIRRIVIGQRSSCYCPHCQR